MDDNLFLSTWKNRLYSNSLLFLARMIILLTPPACSPAPEAWEQQAALQGRLTLALPSTWRQRPLGFGESYRRDHAWFQQGSMSCFIERRQVLASKTGVQLQPELEALVAKNPDAEILTTAVDSSKRNVSVTYRSKQAPRYYQYLIYQQATEQIRFIFQGPDTPFFRQLVATIHETIKLTKVR